MFISRLISTIDSHTAGEPTRVITGGIPHIIGRSLKEKQRWMANNLDDIRKILMREPRGHQDMCGAVIVEPVSKKADIGVLFIDGNGYLDMCGHGSIGVVTVLLETGMIRSGELENDCQKVITLDTPAGLVRAEAKIENKKVVEVSIQNVPSFYYSSIKVDLGFKKNIPIDIAFGGNFFALVKAEDLGIDLNQKERVRLSNIGIKIRNMVNEKEQIVHPKTKQKQVVKLVEIFEEMPYPKNVVVFGHGQIDRSPCGTGLSAKLATLYFKKKITIGQRYVYRSILNTQFSGRILKTKKIGNYTAIIPEITGRAYITGFNQFTIHDDDPFKYGFKL